MEIRHEDMPRLIAPMRLEETHYGPSETEGIDSAVRDGIRVWQVKHHCMMAQSMKYPDIVAAAYIYPELGSTEEVMRNRLQHFMHQHVMDRLEKEKLDSAIMLHKPDSVDTVSNEGQRNAA